MGTFGRLEAGILFSVGMNGCPSITKALNLAAFGDVVHVESGVYSTSRTSERFPLHVPPGVALVGAPGVVLDGEGQLSPTWRPMRADQSLVVLGDHSSISGFSIRNSGGHGLGTLPGARTLVEGNEICDNGEHGLFAAGARTCRVLNNTFGRNGALRLEFETQGVIRAAPGHDIFVQCMHGQANEVFVSGNRFSSPSSDAIGFGGAFDQPDGITGACFVSGNTIEHPGRFGIIVPASFSASKVELEVEITNNKIIGASRAGIFLTAAMPFVRRAIVGNMVHARINGNRIENCGEGIAAVAGNGYACDNAVVATIVGNDISGTSGSSLRLVGGAPHSSWANTGNRISCLLARNKIHNIGGAVVCGVAAVTNGAIAPTRNLVTLRVDQNDCVECAAGILVGRGGRENNVVLEGWDGPVHCVEDLLPSSVDPLSLLPKN